MPETDQSDAELVAQTLAGKKMKRHQNAVTSIDFLVFVLNFAIAIVVATCAGKEFGWVGFVIGFVSGLLILPVTFYAVITIIRKK